MSLATRCDAPGCNAWTHSLLEGWLKVQELPCILEDEYALHFCSWDCLMQFSATKEPITHIQPGK